MKDFVNYTYFFGKINEFDLLSRIDQKDRTSLINRGIQSSVENCFSMEDEDIFRHFSEVTKFDPAL